MLMPECDRVGMIGMHVGPAIELLGRNVLRDRCAIENATLADQSGDAARGECAAAEPEEEDLVVGLVVADEKPIGVIDVVFEAFAERSAGPAIHRIARADAL